VKLIVGLGNPGTVYEKTRHNIGFRVADQIVQNLDLNPLETKRWFRKKLSRLYEGRFESKRVMCLYPLTYMNRSGIAVTDTAAKYKIKNRDIIVIYDDFNLPLGSIRIRPGGSSGGHNGLASVIETMGTQDIPRIRLGIYNEASFAKYADAADFVLSPFESEENETATTMIQKAFEATLMIVREGIPKAMNSFNKVADGDNSTNLKNNMEL
jgi:peptidyl-tRNA hydrolase, PTH1 family